MMLFLASMYTQALFGETGAAAKEYYTNAQLYDLLDPSNDDLPYVYADFDWDHCTTLGYNMELKMNT